MAGVTFKNYDGEERQEIIEEYCEIGDSILLVHEQDNEYDEFAIAVYLEREMLQIGYLNRALAIEIYDDLESGKSVTASITDIRGEETSGVNICMYIEDEDDADF